MPQTHPVCMPAQWQVEILHGCFQPAAVLAWRYFMPSLAAITCGAAAGIRKVEEQTQGGCAFSALCRNAVDTGPCTTEVIPAQAH